MWRRPALNFFPRSLSHRRFSGPAPRVHSTVHRTVRVQAAGRAVDPLAIQPARPIPFHWKRLGRPTFVAKYATPFMNSSTTPNSAPPIWKTNGSQSKAGLAVFFFELRGQDAVQKIFDATVEADNKSVDLTRARYETGVDTEISLVQAENALQTAEAASTNLGIARAQFEHAIAMLIGAPPSNFSMPVKPLHAAPPEIPVGVPSQLLERRPDIAASERNMASANAQIGIATAAFYPNLTLSAQGGLESSALETLFNASSRFWSVGQSVSETLFDAGLRRATVNQFVALYNANVAGYRQTVLNAFQQVEDNMAAVRILSREIQQQQDAEKSAERFLELARARYETGVDQYLNVLVAQTTLLNDQQQLANLRTQAMAASVQLIEALGGGWDRSQLPTPAQVSQKVTKSAIESPQ